MSTITLTPTQAPPVGMWGGSVHRWTRCKSPWHVDAFPAEFKHVGDQGQRQEGWMAEDWCGNEIGWLPDGAEIEVADAR